MSKIIITNRFSNEKPKNGLLNTHLCQLSALYKPKWQQLRDLPLLRNSNSACYKCKSERINPSYSRNGLTRTLCPVCFFMVCITSHIYTANTEARPRKNS